jgi:hypothetical protein
MINVEISFAELVDKYSILEIKKDKIQDVTKLIDITNEIERLSSITKKYIDTFPRFYKQLVYINKIIWDLRDNIRNFEKGTPEFSNIASDIFTFNQKRRRLKHYFNNKAMSYADNICIVHSENILSKLDVVAFLCVEYNAVYLHITRERQETEIRNILQIPNLNFFMGDFPPYVTFDLDKVLFDIPDVFKFEPIHYCAQGLLGDFILQLSVVCENFYKTGRKGIVYMIGTNFRKGIHETYRDIESIVKSQPYIQDLSVDTPEHFDVYLSSWRDNDQLFKVNMYYLFLQEYEIQLGKHAWIKTKNDPQWNTKILIHITQYRFPNNLNYVGIIEQYGVDNIVFLNMETNDFEYFVEKTGIVIPNIYKPSTFEELCVIINSCKLFIGSASMPMCIANSSHVKRIVGLPDNVDDIKLIKGLICHIPNIVSEI